MSNKKSAFKRKYQLIPNEKRLMLMNKIFSKQSTIKEAAIECGINFSTAKMIVQVFKKHGRIGKSSRRVRSKRSIQDIYNSQEIAIQVNKPQINKKPMEYISRVCNFQQITEESQQLIENGELPLQQQKLLQLMKIFGDFLNEDDIVNDQITINDDCVLPAQIIYRKIYEELQERITSEKFI